MEQEHIKVFTGTQLFVTRLSNLLDDAKIATLVKDNIESARLGGFGNLPYSAELFIYTSDLEKATPIIEDFKKEIAE